MKANTSYNDLAGTAAADISDLTTKSNKLEQLGSYFGLDQEKFEVVGISSYGVKAPLISLICVDKNKSTAENIHIVKIRIDVEYEDLPELIFKRLHIILYDKFDKKYSDIEGYEERVLSDLQIEK